VQIPAPGAVIRTVLACRPRGRTGTPDELRARLRQHKAEIVALALMSP
jgi:hypothetical protein